MRDVRCSECGRTVRVLGLAAICPDCGNLVKADDDQAPPPSNVASAASSLVPIDQIISPEEVAAQTTEIARAAPMRVIPVQQPIARWKLILYASLVVIGLVLLVDWIHLRVTRPRATVVVTAPAPVAPPSAPQAAPSIFSEEPTTPVAKPASPAPKPAPAPAPVAPAPPRYPHMALAMIHPVAPEHQPPNRLSDAQVGDSIKRGVDWLVDEFSGSRIKGGDSVDPETFAGRDALAVYALLHAGQAINDPRLGPQTDFIKGALDRVKEFTMSGNRATYSRALRLSALSVYSRAEDRAAIKKDADYLMDSSMGGAFDYQLVPKENRPARWDNSNSQYGVLGLWAAAESGYSVKNVFWSEVEQHWIECQTHSGSWGYQTSSSPGNLALTAGGVTSLFVARDQLLANGSELTPNSNGPRAIKRAIEWLDEGENSVNLDGGHFGYSLYGLERAGLASGYKFFGDHDWYLELANKVIQSQQKDGSWIGGDSPVVETSFVTLFLSRGRHPVLLSKLEFDGDWANYARDLANLTRFASKQLERPLNWQVVQLNRSWQEWTDSAVLYLATDKPPELTDSMVDKLRSFIEAGGLLFTHADKDSAETTTFAAELAHRLFPDKTLAPLPSDHLIYSSLYPMKVRPPLSGISNGIRLLMVHSPTDLAKAWQRRNDKLQRMQFEMGLNIAIYASGRRELRNRVESLFVPDPIDPPVANVPVARLQFKGNWDPEPGAWRRFARSLELDTRLHLDLKPIDIMTLKIDDAPLAVLTGVGPIQLSSLDLDALRQFVVKGGVLMIDSAGGQKEFSDAIKSQLLAKIMPNTAAVPLPTDSPILVGGDREMENVGLLRVRPYTVDMLAGKPQPPIVTLKLGDGQIIFSELDITSGLLGTATWGIAGYQPSVAQALMKNIVLWSMKLPPR